MAEAVLIAGPTASGKSALALAVARALGGAVVNADSMQVYRELRILTARPTPEEEAAAPHRLYGHVPVAESYSAGRYLREARAALAGLRRAGSLPVIVGGTGLYFRALTEGIAPVPPVPDAVRAQARADREAMGAEAFFARLAAADPATSAELRPSDAQRATRAWEVLQATGRPLAAWRAEAGEPPALGPDAVRIVLWPDRTWLATRQEARYDAMLAAGALDEVRALAGRAISPSALKAHGVRELLAVAAGTMFAEAARAAVLTAMRQYAKRQMTWARHQMIAWQKLDPQQTEDNLQLIIQKVAKTA